jgi:hypothetical protein
MLAENHIYSRPLNPDGGSNSVSFERYGLLWAKEQISMGNNSITHRLNFELTMNYTFCTGWLITHLFLLLALAGAAAVATDPRGRLLE